LTATKFSEALIRDPAIYSEALKRIPLRRHALPEEMAGAVLYLASEASSFTTGAAIVCDGGALA
jgi:NAD(P)-dependent dehydrogenase (short-subunit alcohol dehydrogenase family)